MGETPLVDSILCDGLTDAFHKYHMGITGKAHIAEDIYCKQVKKSYSNWLHRCFPHHEILFSGMPCFSA